MIQLFTLVPQEFNDCQALKSSVEKLISRTTKTLSINEFMRDILSNIIFHSLDIASDLAYAIENALDGSFYDMGSASGAALNHFLFNDNVMMVV